MWWRDAADLMAAIAVSVGAMQVSAHAWRQILGSLEGAVLHRQSRWGQLLDLIRIAGFIAAIGAVILGFVHLDWWMAPAAALAGVVAALPFATGLAQIRRAPDGLERIRPAATLADLAAIAAAITALVVVS